MPTSSQANAQGGRGVDCGALNDCRSSQGLRCPADLPTRFHAGVPVRKRSGCGGGSQDHGRSESRSQELRGPEGMIGGGQDMSILTVITEAALCAMFQLAVRPFIDKRNDFGNASDLVAGASTRSTGAFCCSLHRGGRKHVRPCV